MKICSICSAEYEDSIKFCRDDGGALQPKSAGKRCMHCGGETEEGKKFCRHCGASLVAAEPTTKTIQTPEAQRGTRQEATPESPSVVHQQERPFTDKPDTRVIRPQGILQPSTPIPERKVESPSQFPPKPAPPFKKSATPATKASPHTTNKARTIFIAVGIFLVVAAVLGGGLVYYARTQDVSVMSLLKSWFPGKEQPEQEVRGPVDTSIAQVLSPTELGLSISGPGAGDVNRTESLLREKIESQLDNLRSVYQQQIQLKPGLMGSLTLQLTISPSGAITKVEELAAQINDDDFKKSAVEEAYKWRFPEASSGLVSVHYPLLFVPPGMDVATLLKRTQSIEPRLAEPVEPPKPTPPEEEKGHARQLVEPDVKAPRFSEPKTSPVVSSAPRKPQPQPTVTPPPPEPPKPVTTVPYETLTQTFVYREPREDSPRVASIPAGVSVNVVGVRGDWLEVRSKRGNPPGFIRKDSATPAGSR